MRCPNCQHENTPNSRFCISCGTALAAPETSAQQIEALQAEVRRLGGNLVAMNERLAALERVRGVAAPPLQPTPALEVASVTAGEVPGLAEETPAPPDGDIFKRMKEWDWEQIFGGNWLARIGVLAIIIGVAFFLKLAFDNNWIGPTGRVVLGIIAGLAMLGAGEYWQKRYPAYAQALMGGGIALLYLAIFAAFAIFNLITLNPAVGFLLLISVTSAALALRHDSTALAIIGILGAFGAPFILGGFAPETRGAAQAGESIQLLVYIMVVDLGVLALSTFRNWRWFTLLSLLATLVAFGGWYSEFGNEASLLTSQGGLTLIFLIFVGATTLYHIVWRRAPQAFDQALMIINAGAYFGISYGLLWDDFRLWMGGFSILLALFYGGLAYVALKRSAENVRLSFLALGIALVFLTIAIPVQLGDRAWTTIAWAAEGTVLMWLSFTLQMPRTRIFSYAAFVLVAVRLLFFDTPIDYVDLATFRPVLNERFLAFLVSIASIYIAARLLWRERGSLDEWERNAWFVYPIFILAANVFSLWILSAEALSYFDSRFTELPRFERFRGTDDNLRNAQNLSLTAIWAGYAAIALVIGIVKRSRPIRLAALGLLLIPIAKVFVYDIFALERVYRIGAFMGLGVILLASAYLYQRYSRAIRGFLVEK
ncbi:MAG: DUF2339 domain-containing protein [Chloroflexi bacterium]|nr:DUF2339 domain-containing protein [Chloroflexota bacterium]